MIKGMVFDLDGVYFKNGTKNFLENLSSRYGVSLENAREVYLKSNLMKSYKKGEISGKEFWDWAIKQWGVDATQKEILKLLEEGYEINPKALKIIQKIRKEGIKAIICSNNFKERINVLEKRFNFQKDFDYVILSYKHRILKPGLMEKIVEKTKMKPGEIVIIDDSEDTIKAAKELGYKTILCKDPDRLEEYIKSILD